MPRSLRAAFLPGWLFLVASGRAQSAPAPAKSPAATQTLINRVLKETSAIRQLPIKRAVPGRVQSGAQVQAMIARQIAAQGESKELQANEIYLHQLGLAPRGYNLKSSYARLMGEQVGGYYSTQTKTFTTTDRVKSAQLEMVMAHELTHALQDQNFGLSKLEHWPAHDGDARLAMQSLVEGDASYTMTRYVAANPFRALGVLVSSLVPGQSSPAFNAAPRALRDELAFPYLQGLTFVQNLYRRGGWKAVSSAFGDLPQSSQQVLHFDLYLAHKAPVRVPLRDARPALGSGWTLLDHDVNGEEGLRLVLGEFLSRSETNEACRAWAGDRYAVYRGPQSAALVVQDCLWDSPAGAQKFVAAYLRRNRARFHQPMEEAIVSMPTPGGVGAQWTEWKHRPDGVWLQAKGRRVIVLEGSLYAFDAARVFRALWRD